MCHSVVWLKRNDLSERSRRLVQTRLLHQRDGEVVAHCSIGRPQPQGFAKVNLCLIEASKADQDLSQLALGLRIGWIAPHRLTEARRGAVPTELVAEDDAKALQQSGIVRLRAQRLLEHGLRRPQVALRRQDAAPT